MKILLIEDEARTAAYIMKGLGENGFSIEHAADGQSGLRAATQAAHDIIIVDIMLPLLDGWQVIKELRSRGCETPVLVLTARDAVEDRVRGLELGADDYLVKPFAFSELLARVRSILRRGVARPVEVLQIGDLRVDVLQHRAARGSVRLDLTPKEFQLLSLLVRRQNEALSRTLIAEQIWGMNFDCGTNLVDVHIRRLRAKVDDPFAQRLIHTVRGVGYVCEER